MVSIKSLFRDYLEDYDTRVAIPRELGLTILHQIVLGIVDIDLKTHLVASTAEIDIRCATGRTPLGWAIVRSDLNAVKLLVEFGASLSITMKPFDRNVIHEAARYSSIETLAWL